MRASKFVLPAAVVSLVVGMLFLLFPGHADVEFRRLAGIVHLVTGALWATTYVFSRRRRS